ncbi:LysR family transcriptional regulator [Paracoccus seriniphilus]|uniref:LysR family transcriptional regulator n=1 Tax=Paracoccus seriniphilus TaxID=184748 RepID=UPI0035628A02
MSSAPGRLPSIRSLIAFDNIARLGSVTRAADAMNTSQAAVSRHLHQLEEELGAALTARSGRGIILTATGEAYAREVSEALSRLRHAGERVRASKTELTIACTHEVSHLLLLPRYGAMKAALGRDTHIRILTCEYTAIPSMIDAGADIVFEYRKSRPRQPAAAIITEEIMPVAAPSFLHAQQHVLSQSPDQWRDIPRLSLTKANSGWAAWNDWFAAEGIAMPDSPEVTFDNYIYALEAATHGEGILLAWRGFADRYIESGQLVPLRTEWRKSDARLYAVLTANGIAKQAARKCIRVFSGRTHERRRNKPGQGNPSSA